MTVTWLIPTVNKHPIQVVFTRNIRVVDDSRDQAKDEPRRAESSTVPLRKNFICEHTFV